MISELKRKSLPAIAKAVGLENALHHFLANSPWDVADVRRMHTVVTPYLQEREIILCIDETEIEKKVRLLIIARQYIGNEN